MHLCVNIAPSYILSHFIYIFRKNEYFVSFTVFFLNCYTDYVLLRQFASSGQYSPIKIGLFSYYPEFSGQVIGIIPHAIVLFYKY